jgi:hypothetical protein
MMIEEWDCRGERTARVNVQAMAMVFARNHHGVAFEREWALRAAVIGVIVDKAGIVKLCFTLPLHQSPRCRSREQANSNDRCSALGRLA